MNGFIIGNGESRKNFDLNLLRNKGMIVGCNALYRNFTPDILVSVDENMVKEVKESNYQEDFLYRKFEKDRTFKLVLKYKEGNEICMVDRGWASGPTIAEFLCKSYPKLKNIFLIGFDLGRLENGKVSSMYKDSDNYVDGHNPGATHKVSARQLKDIYNMNQDKNFYWTMPVEKDYPIDLPWVKNFYKIDYDKMMSMIGENNEMES